MNRLLMLVIFIILSVPFLGTCKELPLPEHNMLKMDDGQWKATLSLFEDGKKTIQFDWKEDNFMLGELWSIGKLYGDYNGVMYEGFATLGFSQERQRYVGTWVDNVSTEILQMEGEFDVATNTLVLFYTIKKSSGLLEQRKNVMVYHDETFRDFNAYALKQDKWVKVMHIDYRRISAKH